MRYIGSKTKLLDKIREVIENNTQNVESLCDIFSGTAAVSNYFKKDYRIISNDFLYFSYVIQMAIIKNNENPSFTKLTKNLDCDVFDYLNGINEHKEIDFNENDFLIKNNYSSFCGRNYLTEENATIIDKWRIVIEKWKNQSLIDENEYFYLVACVVETVPFYSNISGTYGAFLKTWDKRALKKIELIRLDVLKGKRDNACFNDDSDKLISELHGDLLYIDPPYNERQYLPNYHLLETIARYDYPEIKGKTGVRKYDSQKSKWCSKKEVYHVFENMIKSANFRYILLSYNTDGLMSIDEIVSIMKKYSKTGEVKIFEIDYTRFKSRELKNTSELKELLFLIEKETYSTSKQKDILLKSPFNYIGGKTKILNQLLELFPNNISTFVEPFCGGYNVGLNLEFRTGLAIDINRYLIELLNYFKEADLNQTIAEIKQIINEYKLSLTNVEGYNKLRDDFNSNTKDIIKLFVLICFSFNHQIRFNNSGKFNTPFGKERSCYNSSIEKKLISFISRLQQQNIDFVCSDFKKIDLSLLDDNSFVYCDPPYFISTGSYNDGVRYFGDWTLENDLELMAFLDKLNENGIKFALSNVFMHKGMENKRLIEWAGKYFVYFIDSNYNNSNYHSQAREHDTVEVLITNYRREDINGR